VQKLRATTKTGSHSYEITVGRGTLRRLGEFLRKTLGERAQRVAVISNRKVFSLHGAGIAGNLKAHNLISSPWLMPDGERFKSLQTVAKAVDFLATTEIERTDAVLGLGGGVVGDLAGFAAAIYLRGIPLFQVPTTLLAQIDASIGGKTGVNLPQGKNLVGAFHQPAAVIIDLETLRTLTPRELTAGWCETVKQAAVANRDLFDQTTKFLRRLSSNEASMLSPELEKLIASHCRFKAAIVSRDERESTDRMDHRSRRILNFGHTIGHAMEAVTRYRRFRHGEAVGYGVLVAGELSKNIGLLAPTELELLREAIHLCGQLPKAEDLDETKIIELVKRDKKTVGGRVQWVLLERLGRARIVDGKEITRQLLRTSLRAALR